MKLDDFLRIEKKYGLIEDKVDGFAYWTYFRSDLEWDLEVQKNAYGEAHVQPTLSFAERLGKIGKRIWYILFCCKIPRKHRKIMVLNHERRVLIDDYYECIYTERLTQEFSDSLVLERPYFQKHFRPVKTKNLVYTDWITTKASIFYLWKKIFKPKEYSQVKQRISERIEKPVLEICEAYGLTYDINRIVERMVCGYYVYQVKRKSFDAILDKIQPKIIVEVVGYNIDCMIINELAFQRNIPTVELQHGTTGEEHIAYNYPQDVQVQQFARYFFAFSRFWTETANFPVPKENLRVVGFPYMEQKAEIAKAKVSKEGKRKILFISQGTIGKMLSDIAVELQNIMDKEKYEIIYKLHPGEYAGWKERYVKLAGSSIKVIDNNQVDLYELFAAADYQIGAYGSTATFEGLQFDLKTYVLKEKASAELKMLCRNGLAEYFESASNLYQMICGDTDREEDKIAFWEKDALKTMKREIENIISSQ